MVCFYENRQTTYLTVIVEEWRGYLINAEKQVAAPGKNGRKPEQIVRIMKK